MLRQLTLKKLWEIYFSMKYFTHKCIGCVLTQCHSSFKKQMYNFHEKHAFRHVKFPNQSLKCWQFNKQCKNNSFPWLVYAGWVQHCYFFKTNSQVQCTTFHPRERMLAKISTTWKVLLKLLVPEILFSSWKSIHSFLHSPCHWGLKHRHERLLRKTTKSILAAKTVGYFLTYSLKCCLFRCDSSNNLNKRKGHF